MDKAEFEKMAAGLPVSEEIDFDAEVICIEPIDGAYFRNNHRQRCIVRKNGTMYVSFYD